MVPQEPPRSEPRHDIACACAGETEITWFARTYPLICQVMTPSSLLAGCDTLVKHFTAYSPTVPSYEFYNDPPLFAEQHVEYSALNTTILYRA